MKVQNVGQVDVSVEGVVVAAGEISANVDDSLARKIVAASGGNLALAPEVEHTKEELEHADEKTDVPAPEEPIYGPKVVRRQEEERRKAESESGREGSEKKETRRTRTE